MPNKLSQSELKEIIQWDVKNWGRTIDFWEKNFEIKSGMRVLALGEREGGLSYFFAEKGCEVVCSDYNEFPETTVDFHKDKGVSDRITYRQIDMRAIDFSDDEFDVVVFKSVLGALETKESQTQAMKEMYRVLKSGGALLFAENAVGSSFHKWARKKFVNWGERWRYISKKDIKEWASDYKSHNFKSFGTLATFGRSEKQRSVFATFDSVVSPITPANWRYIYFGVFFK